MTELAWGLKVSQGFRDKVLSICHDFDWGPYLANCFMSCMAFESAETFDPGIRNYAGSSATGLIQFMPATAVSLGTTVQALMLMAPEEQLEYVKKYFQPYHSRVKTLSDMYMSILLPKAVGKPEEFVLFNKGTVAYRQNSGLDENSDGQITKAEASALVSGKLRKGLLPQYCYRGT